jgi:RNA polymerase sigma-54 factor
MKLIQLPLQAMEQRVKQEIEENPALEEGAEFEANDEAEFDDYDEREDNIIEAEDINIDDYLSDDEIPDYRMQANNYSADDEENKMPLAAGASFTELLMDQLHLVDLNDADREIAEYLIGTIDESGYIRRDLLSIMDDLAFTRNIFTTEEDLDRLLRVVQDLDPPGVGARDLQECLILQLERKELIPAVENALKILEKGFNEFTKKHYSRLESRFDLSEEELKDAIDEVLKLNPKPGGSLSGSRKVVQTVIPDFVIHMRDGELELNLHGRNAPELHVSRDYQEMLKTYKAHKTEMTRSEKEAVMFVKQKLDSAKWFIDAIRQRQHTLYVTMSAIMEHQQEYFLTGDERKLKPMILKDIADVIHMDISTVSRVASSKYVQTPYGTFLLKSFFSESMTNEDGEEVSTKKIKKILEDLIEEEDKKKPITDEKLAIALKEKGFPIARRTVAKYREQLNIPVARLRKEL